MKIKILAIVLAILIIINFLFMVFKIIKPLMFWIVLIICGLIAYKGIPYLRKKS